jgi:hypothetical protein
MPPSTIGCRIRSRSQTGVWIKGPIPHVSCPVQFNAFVVAAAPAWMVPRLVRGIPRRPSASAPNLISLEPRNTLMADQSNTGRRGGGGASPP